MGSTHFAPPYSTIQDSDVRVVANKVGGYSRCALLICSDRLSGKQILDELQSQLCTVQTNIGPIHMHRDGGSFVINEIGKNAFLFDIIESPEDYFASVIIYVVAMRSDESDYEWKQYGEYVFSIIETIEQHRIDLPYCVLISLTLDRTVQKNAEGFTFFNEELADIFRRCKYVEPPDYNTHMSGKYTESSWLAHLASTTTQRNQEIYSGSTGGCYVATAVYGSYDCPEVWTLRRFRDNTLSQSWYGRAFIKVYYAISPILVRWFGKMAWFNRFFKSPLDKLVTKLKLSGYDDSPYTD